MVSLRAVYSESMQDLVAFLNASCASWGLEVLQPLEPGTYSWDWLRLADEKVFASVRQPFNYPGCEAIRWFDLFNHGCAFEAFAQVFENLLAASVRPTEVILVDHDIEFADGDFSYALAGEDPFAYLPTMETNYYMWGIHYLRALDCGLAGSMAEWALLARERGFGWGERHNYGILDVHWNASGIPRSDRDPITGLATEDEFFPFLRSRAQGTLIVISLYAVSERSFERWCLVLPQVARLLETQVLPGDLLTRLYSPRRFALLKSGMSAAALAGLLRESFQELKGQVLSVNWTDEATADGLYWKACELEEQRVGVFL